MIRYLWGGMIIIGIVVGIATGRLEAISETILQSAKSSTELALSMIGIYALWLGLLNIANKAGLVDGIAKRLSGIIGVLFRGIKKQSHAIGLITLNLVANMLGMGNAATPFGLRAMQALQEQNKQKDTASDDMCMFVIVNTASVQLLPLSIIAVRAAAGSTNPAEIMPTALLATGATAVLGVAAALICRKGNRA